MYKNKKVFALVVAVIFLIIFVAAAAIGTRYALKNNAKPKLSSPTPEATPESSSAIESEDKKDCNKIHEQRIRDGCYLNIASINQNPSACGKIPDQDQKDTCYLAVVAVNQDLSVCNRIQNQESREYCLTGGQSPMLPNSTIFFSKPPNPKLLLSKWKTYTNERQKYSFRYPSEWVFQVIFSSPTGNKLNVIREEVSNRNDYNWNWSVRIAAWDNPANLSLIDWLKSRKEPGGLISKDMPFVPNTVVGKAGVAALQTWTGDKSTWDKPGECVQSCPALDIYFVYKEKGYRVELEGQDAVKKENQEIFKQVISTFEFID